MAEAETHRSDTPSRTPPAGQQTQIKAPVESKQGTDAPKGMPIVLLVSTVGAAVALWIVWMVFFNAG